MNERFPRELHLVLPLLNEFLDLVGLQLHDAADAELGRPLALVEVTEDVL